MANNNKKKDQFSVWEHLLEMGVGNAMLFLWSITVIVFCAAMGIVYWLTKYK